MEIKDSQSTCDVCVCKAKEEKGDKVTAFNKVKLLCFVC